MFLLCIPEGILSNAFIGVLGDLEGLKVSHDFDAMDEGEMRVLTLKDTRILDNEGTCFSAE